MSKKYFFPKKQIITIKETLLRKYRLFSIEQLGTSGYFDTGKYSGADDRYYILKIRKEKSQKIKNKFLGEVYVNQLLDRYRNKSKVITFPQYFNSQTDVSPEWLIYYYIGGFAGGGWYNFNKKEFKQVFAKLAEMINFLSKINVRPGNLRQVRYREIIGDFYQYKKLLKKYFTAAEIQKGEQIIKKRKKLLNSARLILTHGDLHPSNLILTFKNQLAVIDWSEAHLNNRAFDAVFVWLELWNKKTEQKRFFSTVLKQVKNQQEFKNLFTVDVVRLTPKMLDITTDGEKYFNKLKKKQGFLNKKDRRERDILKKAIQYYISNYKNIIKSFE